MTINKRLERKREELGLTKSEFAKKIGVSHQVYSNYANGRDIPSTVLQKIAMTFDVSLDYIILGKKKEEIFNIPNTMINKITTKINSKLSSFPLNTIIVLIFILEQNEKVNNKKEMFAVIEKITYDVFPFITKLDKKSIINFVDTFLTDDDIFIIFYNKNRFLYHLNFLKNFY